MEEFSGILICTTNLRNIMDAALQRRFHLCVEFKPLTIEGITSLSTKPIKMITGLGIFIFFVSILVLIYSLVRHYTGNTIPGWTTTVLSVWAIGGLIMISLGEDN